MGQKVHIAKDVILSYTGAFVFSDFLSHLRAWCKEYGYSVILEESYEEKEKGDTKSVTIKWKFDKKQDDYHQFSWKLKIALEGYRQGLVDNKKVEQGTLKLTINADLEHDFENKWQKKPWQALFRGIVDRFVRSEKEDVIFAVLRKETEEIQVSVKKFLGL